METPLFIAAFNRPDCLKKLLSEVRKARPQTVYFCLDAPRPHVVGEQQRCSEVKEIVYEFRKEAGSCVIDEAPKNLGCGARISSGLTNFFKRYERGVILEDDTIPGKSFFRYCEEALEEYRLDSSVGHICGSRFESQSADGLQPHATIFPHIWGWATWARAWSKYDFKMRGFRENHTLAKARKFVNDDYIWSRWTDSFDRVSLGNVDTWDYQWTFACWVNEFTSIVPPRNLVSNIGLGSFATHTRTMPPSWTPRVDELSFPLNWNNISSRNAKSDRSIQELRYGYMQQVSPLRRKVRAAWWKLKT